MTQNSENSGRVRVATLKAAQEHAFEIVPDEMSLARIAKELNLLDLRKLRFTGHILPEGTADWRVEAELGATVVQPCVITLEPVTTRVEEQVTRRFLRDVPAPLPETDEVEMPEDDTIEPLGEVIDLHAVMQEALALALPPYPKRSDAELEKTDFAPPGATPLRDEDVKPFASLAALKRKLEGGDGDSG
ncbi:YceD family protein [Roseovarius aestuariivivens]|uniref:YceD family protein n=1 Tax=Roseovarius aestuariivivens TaxID=1888910 RepID=UPI00107FE4E3|nr:DUF177 domain-containing protein [Roseovarius aestuariivivens]